MKRSGSADLPLHYGHIPQWLAERMAKLGLAIVETIVLDYGKDEAIKRLTRITQRTEQNFTPNATFDKVIEEERANS